VKNEEKKRRKSESWEHRAWSMEREEQSLRKSREELQEMGEEKR
jgi:hypothetical protein